MVSQGHRQLDRALGDPPLINELARHAGHADIIRESIDGATLYELVAGIEGWEETEWIKPWKAGGV